VSLPLTSDVQEHGACLPDRRAILGAFAKLRKATISFVMSVRLSVRAHGTTRLPLDGFSGNMIFENFLKIC